MKPIEVINFYSKVKNKKKSHNPHFNIHGINVPFRMIIAGSSGSTKTNTALNILKQMSNTFEKVIVCCKSKCEPLYEFLEEKLGKFVEFYEDGKIPSIDEFSVGKQTLIIFDDLCLKKDQSSIIEYFIRGRKKDISCIYISQSYYKCPKTIRINCNYIVLKKLPSKNDLKSVLDDNALGIDIKDLEKIYKWATNDKFSWFMIDVDAEEDKKYRKNFSIIEFSH